MTMSQEAPPTDVLLVRIGARLAAVPLRDVVEVLRPLPLQHIEGAAAFVAGLAVVRGAPTPVVDLRVLLGASAAAPASRWVRTQLRERRVVLAVDEVVGTRPLAPETLGRLPALLEGTSDAVAALGVLDQELLVLMQASRRLEDALDAAAGSRP